MNKIKKLLKSVREYKNKTILTPIIISLEVIFEILVTYFMAFLVDKGIEMGDINYTIKIGLILSFISIISLICGAVAANYASYASAGFAKNLRQDVFNKIQKLSFSNIDKFSTPSLITRLTVDISRVQASYQMIIRLAIRAPLMIIFSFVMIVTISVKMALIFLCVMPILLIGLMIIMRLVHPIFEKGLKEYDRLNMVVEENINGIRVVKSFVAEEKEKKKFNKVSYKIYKLFKKGENIFSLSNPLMQFAVYLTMLLISWIGAKLIVNGSLTTGQLLSLFTYIMQVMGSLMMISMVLIMIVISKASINRLVEVLDEDIDIRNNSNPITKVLDGSIAFNHVNFSYVKDNEKLCLTDINFKIDSGSTIGIIGGTGSSKSTLVQLIPRLYDVTNGEIIIGGINVKDYDIRVLRNEVAMVLQKNTLFSGTIQDNLRWGNKDASMDDIKKVSKIACASEFIESMKDGYNTYIEQGGTNVSGGQKQRLCIARALLKNPKILILDDSTSAVDTKTEGLLKKSLRNELKNTTKIIIAQRVLSIVDADRIIVLDDGRINGIGTHNELLKNNKIYREVYNSQVKGGIINE